MEQKTVLIVEDEEILAVHLRHMLAGLGYMVSGPVSTGEEAIATVAEARPDIILMDISLAGEMDGITAAGHIRSTVDVPVIFLTGYAQDPMLQQAKSTMPYGYLIKPASRQELAATIEMALNRFEVDCQLREREEELSAIYENAPLIMMLVDGESKICKVNRTATEFARRSTDSMIDLRIGEALHCLHASDMPEGCGFGPHCVECAVRRTVVDTVATGRSHHQVEANRTFSVEGEERNMVLLLSTARLKVRQKPMVMLSMQDITERKRAEDELQKAHDELEQRVLERTADLLHTNKSLNQEVEERTRREEVLRVCLMLSEYAPCHSLDELLQKALDEMERLTGSCIGFFHFLEKDQKTLSIQSWSTSTIEAFCTAEGKGLHYSVDQAGVWVDCIRERRAVIHNDYAGLPDRKGLPPGHAAVVREVIVPVMRGDHIVAILGVGNKEQDYDFRDVETISELASMTWDVVQRKRAEERLFRSKATLSMVLDGISDPLILLDSGLRVKRLNTAAKDYYGLTRNSEAAGKLCFEALMGRSSPCEGCERPFSELRGYAGSYERRCAKDPDRVEKVIVDVVRNESGAPKASIVRISDITQAKMLEKQLIQSEKLASLGLLISGIAHEINNPNTFVSFNIPILRDYLQELIQITDAYAENRPSCELCGMPYLEFRNDVFKLLDNVEHGSSRINATVMGLKEFSRMRGSVEKRQVTLKAVIEKALAICGAELRKKVRSLSVDVPDDLPPLFTDPEALEQVLINLLINAVHAMDKQDSWVKVTVVPDYRRGHLDRCIIEVADNGCGIDEKVRNRIFDPFFTTKTSVVGTGLGLYVCQNLIQKVGGYLEVDSSPGEGSTFRVVLPYAREVDPGNGRP